jgi:hypothetical protein
MGGYVYVVETADGVKIGSSAQPKKRIESLFRLHKFKARSHVSSEINGYRKAEAQAHIALDAHRIKGEYFNVPFEKGVEVVEGVVQWKIVEQQTTRVDVHTDGKLAKISVVSLLHESDDPDRQVNLSLMLERFNVWRVINGEPTIRLIDILDSVGCKEFMLAVNRKMPGKALIKKVGQHISSQVYAHIYVAIYVAEQLSTSMHLEVIVSFVDKERRKEYRLLAGADRQVQGLVRSRMGDYFEQVNILLTQKILGADAKTEDWGKATVAQTHARYDHERRLSDMLSLGLVRDFDHLKELIGRL